MFRHASLAALFATALVASQLPSLAAEEKAIFAGGCFWCVEADFDKVPGVLATTSGYIGGENDNPTYQDHSRYRHREAVLIEYDPAVVTYERLLHIFFRSVDPTDAGGQFCDRGFSYTTAIYAVDEEQRQLAEEARAEAASVLGRKLATEIVEAPRFWPAEDYHQDYYKMNPLRYSYYRAGCGRDRRLDQVWGDAARSGIEG